MHPKISTPYTPHRHRHCQKRTHLRQAREHLAEVLADAAGLRPVPDHLQQVLVPDEVEAGEGRALPPEVGAERPLHLAEQRLLPLELPREVFELEHVQDAGLGRHLCCLWEGVGLGGR